MKRISHWAAALLSLCLLLSLLPAASADDEMDALYRDKTWDEVIDAFLKSYGTDSSAITLGYYNTVTGEEHYLNPDQYMVSASMYKVPLNMLFTERVHNGEMDWDTVICGYQYEKALEESIVHSNNDLSVNMLKWTLGNGNWQEGRRALAPYMGLDPENVDYKFLENNYSTARQVISCLRLLYEENERFPRVIETMQRAEPHNYFKLREQRFNIGHKYGFLLTDWHLYMNDCGIAYTDDPILLVMFTDNVNKAYDVMTDYCTLMCDYAQYHTAERKAREAEEEARRKAEEEEAARILASAEPVPTGESPEPTVSGEEPMIGDIRRVESSPAPASPSVNRLPLLYGAVLAAGFLVASAALLILAARCRRSALAPIVLALLLTLGGEAALFLPRMSRPKGDPGEAVVQALDAMEDGRWETAYSCLEGNSRLGLETPPDSQLGRALYDALRDHFRYRLYGECQRSGELAHQLVEFTYLDLERLRPALENETMSVLTDYARSRPLDEIYGEEGGYRQEVRQEATLEALARLLEHPEDYVTTTGIQLELRYRDEAWKLTAGNNLLKVLLGGLEREGGAA